MQRGRATARPRFHFGGPVSEAASEQTVSKQQFDDIIQKFTETTDSLKTQLQDERVARAKLEGKAEALTKPPIPEKRWTRAELQPKVDDGTMTQVEAEEILRAQEIRDLDAKWEKRLQERDAQHAKDSAIEARIASYTTRIPDLADKESADFKKVEKAFQELVAMGSPSDSKATEVAALRIAFGPPEKLPDRTAALRETHEETGGSGVGSDKGSDDPKEKVPAYYRGHYQNLINEGYYSGWDDPRIASAMKLATKK